MDPNAFSNDEEGFKGDEFSFAQQDMLDLAMKNQFQSTPSEAVGGVNCTFGDLGAESSVMMNDNEIDESIDLLFDGMDLNDGS